MKYTWLRTGSKVYHSALGDGPKVDTACSIKVDERFASGDTPPTGRKLCGRCAAMGRDVARVTG